MKSIMPKNLFLAIRLMRDIFKIPIILVNYIYDTKRYIFYSSTVSDDKRVKLEAKITVLYHVLEKGLSMPEPRMGFGKDRVSYLISLLIRYENSGYSMESSQLQAAIQVLDNYFEFHKNTSDSQILILKDKASEFRKYGVNDDKIGGTIIINKRELLNNTQSNFKCFAESRYSIRNFSEENVEIDLLFDAIKIAQKTPSVCNRQSSRVYIIKDEEKIKETLALQNGNRGFGHLINKILIVTSDLNVFNGVTERNQSFIDGGMYSMSLLYSLHYKGLGACPLNWSVDKEKDIKLRKSLNIKVNENIMMVIGVGHIPDSLTVAISKRKDINEIVTMI